MVVWVDGDWAVKQWRGSNSWEVQGTCFSSLEVVFYEVLSVTLVLKDWSKYHFINSNDSCTRCFMQGTEQHVWIGIYWNSMHFWERYFRKSIFFVFFWPGVQCFQILIHLKLSGKGFLVIFYFLFLVFVTFKNWSRMNYVHPLLSIPIAL